MKQMQTIELNMICKEAVRTLMQDEFLKVSVADIAELFEINQEFVTKWLAGELTFEIDTLAELFGQLYENYPHLISEDLMARIEELFFN